MRTTATHSCRLCAPSPRCTASEATRRARAAPQRARVLARPTRTRSIGTPACARRRPDRRQRRRRRARRRPRPTSARPRLGPRRATRWSTCCLTAHAANSTTGPATSARGIVWGSPRAACWLCRRVLRRRHPPEEDRESRRRCVCRLGRAITTCLRLRARESRRPGSRRGKRNEFAKRSAPICNGQNNFTKPMSRAEQSAIHTQERLKSDAQLPSWS